jgi:hypothetical protein
VWNESLGIPIADYLLVADDVVGGAFAINGGALGPATGNVFYFAPDSLAWEDLEMGHGDFVHWCCEGNLQGFYESMRWPGWEAESETVSGDQALHLYPPPWTKEGSDVSRVSRRIVPVHEVWTMQQDFVRQLGSR